MRTETARQKAELLLSRLLDRYRTAQESLRAARTQPSSPGDAESIFFQAVDRNFVSRLAVEVAATLRVVDRVLGGVTDVGRLAADCDVDPGAFRRLLRVLEARGLVKFTDHQTVEVTAAGTFLADSHPHAWRSRLDLDGMGRRMDVAVFNGLLTSVRTGKSAYEDVHGVPFWADIEAHGLAPSFQDHMRYRVADIARDVASLPEVASAASVMDVCGGDGALLEVLLERHPRLLGSVLELPGSAALARDRFARSGVGSRASVIAGDVFSAVPDPHDVCVLSWVLHDWPDGQALKILETCVKATATGGSIVVIERPRDGSLDVLESDLRMLVFFGGQERSRHEWLTLFAAAGLAVNRESAVGSSGFVAFCLDRTGPALNPPVAGEPPI